MAIKNLYLSHQSYNWSKLLKIKKNIVMLHGKIVEQIISSFNAYECYTSLEDIRLDQIEKIFNEAETITLIDLNSTSLSNNANLYSYIHYINFLLSNKHLKQKTVNVKSILEIIENINSLHVTRHINSPVIWVVGCSVTAGVGIKNEQRYGYLVAKELHLPEILLAKSGASIFWAADQILRSDIKKDDTVVWGITSTSRIDVAEEFKLLSTPITGYLNLPQDKQYWKITYFDSPTQVVTNLRYIYQVINYCKKIGASLYLVNLLDPTWTHLAFSDEIMYINLTKNFNHAINNFNFLDYGIDNNHPGPLQHQEYAQKILNFIKENNYGNQTV